jgi:type II secretory pathway component PulJ
MFNTDTAKTLRRAVQALENDVTRASFYCERSEANALRKLLVQQQALVIQYQSQQARFLERDQAKRAQEEFTKLMETLSK